MKSGLMGSEIWGGADLGGDQRPRDFWVSKKPIISFDPLKILSLKIMMGTGRLFRGSPNAAIWLIKILAFDLSDQTSLRFRSK